MWNLKKQKETQRKKKIRFLVTRSRAGNIEGIAESCPKVQTSSYKINKYYGCKNISF